MKTENELFADFCDCLDYAKEDMGIGDDWQVLARAQQTMTNVDKTILVDRVGERQRGFQNTRFEMGLDGRLHEFWEWIEEYHYQISCVRERRISDSVETVTADDVATRLKAWINSMDGIAYLRSKGLAPLVVYEIVAQQYTSENDVYQRYVHFDVTLQYVHVIDRTPPVVNAMDLGIKHYPLCNDEEGGSIVWDRIWDDGSGSES